MAAHDETISSWNDYRIHLLSELERLNTSITALTLRLDDGRRIADERIGRMEVEIATLKTKVGLMAVGASMVISTVISIIIAASKHP